MKKLTKLVSAVAFASALALVGCANPSGGSEKTLPKISASDVQKPAGYDKASNPVKNAGEGNLVIEAIMGDSMLVMENAFTKVAITEEFKKANVPNENVDYKDEADLIAGVKAKYNEKKDFKGSCENGYKAGDYKDKDSNVFMNIKNSSSKFVYDMNYQNEKLVMSQLKDELASTKVVDTKKMNLSDCSIKSLIANVNSKFSENKIYVGDEFNALFSNTPGNEVKFSEYEASSTNVLDAVVFFEVGEKNGICHLTFNNSSTESVKDGKDSSTTPVRTVSVTFYDIDGTDSYAYTEAEAKELVKYF